MPDGRNFISVMSVVMLSLIEACISNRNPTGVGTKRTNHRGTEDTEEEPPRIEGNKRVSLSVLSSVGSVPLWFIFYFFCSQQ